MSENEPAQPAFPTKPAGESSEEMRRLREANRVARERSKKKEHEKKTDPVQEGEGTAAPAVPLEPPKRKVVKVKKVTNESRLVIDEEASNLSEKLGLSKRTRFEDANSRVTTYIDNEQLKQLRQIKQEYNVPMTEVIYKALAEYLTK